MGVNTLATMSDSASASRFGPYHGQYEGHARISLVLGLTETIGLIVLPWLLGWVDMLRNPDVVYLKGLPMSPGWLAVADFLGIFAAYAYYSLYRRISYRITEGVPGYAFLDRIRLSFSLLPHTVIALVVVLVLKIR
jgi:hypothetical protein